MFKKVRMMRESDEWVLDLAGHDIPMISVKSAITAMFIVVLVYWTYNIAHADALAYIEYLSKPKVDCVAGTCTYCIPYADGNTIRFNCTSSKLVEEPGFFDE